MLTRILAAPLDDAQGLIETVGDNFEAVAAIVVSIVGFFLVLWVVSLVKRRR